MIYLDYAASSPPFPEVTEQCLRVASEVYGNPGAIHSAGSAARALLQESRKTLAGLLRVRPEELFFTSGATEANNWAVRMSCTQPRKKHIVCSAAEHASVLAAVRAMESEGCRVTLLKPDRQGRISPETVEQALRPDTALLCVQAVNNETGVLQDIGALAQIARRKGVRFLCDGVQSFGHVSQELHRADLISLSAHKFGGPRGVGCLIVRQPNVLPPLLAGGGQEFGLRSGTENLPAIAGFALAARLAAGEAEQEQRRLEALMQRFRSGLEALCPGLMIAGAQSARSPGILCCAFPGFSGEEMTVLLNRRGICVSPGAACSARGGRPSHVLLSMGCTAKEAAGFVRFSAGRLTTDADIDRTLQAIAEILA